MTTVLVVDDAADNRALLNTLLRQCGYRVIEAAAGWEALALARREHPEVVVTDVLMRGMDGYALARELRADPRTAAAALVFYTASYTEPELRLQMRACGVRQVVPKGGDPRRLLRAVDEALTEPPVGPGPVPAAVDRLHSDLVNAKLVAKIGQLDTSEARLRAMAESSPAGIFLLDADGQASYVNERLIAIMAVGRDDLLGWGWLRCFPAERQADVAAAAIRGDPAGTDHHCRVRLDVGDGRRQWLDAHLRLVAGIGGTLAGAVGTVDDVTEIVTTEERVQAEIHRRELVERVRVTERLGSLRTLAGGVAHDYNNLLTVILSFTGFVQDAISAGQQNGCLTTATASTALCDLEHVQEAARRATALTRQLQQFGGRATGQPDSVQVDDIVRAESDLLRERAGSIVDVRTDLDPLTAPARGDARQIRDVLHAVVSNALAAMPEGGDLLVQTANLRLTGTTGINQLPPGDYVRLTVRDTGCGMSPDVLERAIEPFFTTRARAGGPGLGLAVAYGIATELGGDLRLASQVGVGTTVDLLLPVVSDEIAAGPVGPHPDGPGTTGAILVVDDEPAVGELVVRLLSRHGYRCVRVSSGQEALALLEAGDPDVRLVLSDLVMPQMLGSELGRRIRSAHPALPVVYMSGFADPAVDEHGLDPGARLLAKPFAEDELLDAVRSALPALPTP